MAKDEEPLNRELYYRDADGTPQDKDIWDGILGDDDLDTWDPSKGDLPPSQRAGHPKKSPLEQAKELAKAGDMKGLRKLIEKL